MPKHDLTFTFINFPSLNFLPIEHEGGFRNWIEEEECRKLYNQDNEPMQGLVGQSLH